MLLNHTNTPNSQPDFRLLRLGLSEFYEYAIFALIDNPEERIEVSVSSALINIEAGRNITT